MSVTCTPLPPPLNKKSRSNNNNNGRKSAKAGGASDGAHGANADAKSPATGGDSGIIISNSGECKDSRWSPTQGSRSPRDPEGCPRLAESAGSCCGSQQHQDDVAQWPDRPPTPTIIGHEVMEERARFTIYKVLVKRAAGESWVVFRRYTDFSRLNDKLREMFPGFRLALPPKRWFKDNFDVEFLEERTLGLAAFLQNLVAHQDIANCVPVREFLCLDDSPGPFDSLEESRAFCESLEETNFRLLKELSDSQREAATLREELLTSSGLIETLHAEIRELKQATTSSHSTMESPPSTSDFPEPSVIDKTALPETPQ